MDVRPRLTDSPSIWDGAQPFTGVHLLSGLSVCAEIDAPRVIRSITRSSLGLPSAGISTCHHSHGIACGEWSEYA